MSSTFGIIKKGVMSNLGRQALSVSNADIEEAINLAIDQLRAEMPYDIAPNESVTLVDATYEYDISTVGMSLVYRITMSDSDGLFPAENIIPGYLWTTIASSPKLKFDERGWAPVAGRTLRIEGQAYQNRLSADTDVFYGYTPAVVFAAAASIVGNLGNLNRERFLSQKAESARLANPMYPHPNSREVLAVASAYVREAQGATSVADNGTIAHGLSSTPTGVIVTTTVANEYASVSAIGATTFTVQLTKHDGTAGTTQTVYWRAWI